MVRRAILGLIVCAAMASAGQAQLISQERAMAHGLRRAWATQVQLEQGRDHLESLVPSGKLVLAQSARATIHVFDAETGRTLWAKPVGNRQYPSLPPGANETHVAVLNGAWLYLLDARTGRYAREWQLAAAPSGPPVLDDARIFVPLINGALAVYELPRANEDADVELGDPYNVRGGSVSLSRPTLSSAGQFAWTTAAGLTYVVSLDQRRLLYEFRALDEVAGSAAYRDPCFYVTSRDGNAYAFHESTGRETWRFNAGYPILEPPSVVGEMVLVAPRGHGMFALDAESGRELWWTPQVTQHIAASPTRLYASDQYGRILILNRETGVRLDVMATERMPFHPRNEFNDRLYLATSSGLVQCLHEESLAAPAWLKTPEVKPDAAEVDGDQEQEAEERPAMRPDEEMPAEDAFDDTFGDENP